MAQHPDILLFFSDQHHARFGGFAGSPDIRTPNLDRIASRGVTCTAAYTNCPLCVPARSALLTGQLPSQTHIYSNSDCIDSNQATFLHALGAAGYETVLCGRMHFNGPDQRHGFTRRIAPDITPMHLGVGPIGKGAVPFAGSYGMGGCLSIIGGGTSPVLEYDKHVIQAALAYLQEDHQRPQCLVVGTYGPHFPYVGPPEYYEHYLQTLVPPRSWFEEPAPHPVLDAKRSRQAIRRSNVTAQEEPVDDRIALKARAAYAAMVTRLDEQIGEVYEAWTGRLLRTGRQGLFVYTSDHGDTCGEHRIFGKQTFYEGSAAVPMLFAGAGLPPGRRVHTPVSLVDLSPTLCTLAGAQTPPQPAGEDIRPLLSEDGEAPADRNVLCEFNTTDTEGERLAGRMIRRGKRKLVHYHGRDEFDQLFDLAEDPDELVNRLHDEPSVAADLKESLTARWAPEAILHQQRLRRDHHCLISQWGAEHHPEQPDTWQVPAYAQRFPDDAI
jgi:choline-sulfatase